MNVLLLMGRGIEGTGNTRITIEIEEYMKKIGVNVHTIAASDKDWNREKSQENDIILHKFASGLYNPEEHVDVCVITSVPAKMKATSKAMIENEEEILALYENFTKTLEELKSKGTKIVYLQVDHKIHSIQRNYYVLDNYLPRFFKVLDRIIVHNMKNDFINKFLEKKVKPLNLGTTYDVKEQLLISCDIDNERNLVGKSEKIDKLCYYIGRSARWKGWREFRDLHYNILKEREFISIIEGIETSINAKQDMYNLVDGKYKEIKETNIVCLPYLVDEKNPSDLVKIAQREDRQNVCKILMEQIESDSSMFRYQPAFITGPYNRREALKRMSKAKFGMFFTFVGEDYSGPLENTFLEIVASGTIPVIRKELYESAQFNGDRMSNYNPDEIGVLVYDEENPSPCIERMTILDFNNELYNLYVDRATSFCKNNFDIHVILKRVFDLINI